MAISLFTGCNNNESNDYLDPSLRISQVYFKEGHYIITQDGLPREIINRFEYLFVGANIKVCDLIDSKTGECIYPFCEFTAEEGMYVLKDNCTLEELSDDDFYMHCSIPYYPIEYVDKINCQFTKEADSNEKDRIKQSIEKAITNVGEYIRLETTIVCTNYEEPSAKLFCTQNKTECVLFRDNICYEVE